MIGNVTEPVYLHFLMDIPCHLYAKDREGKVVWCNKQQAVTLGFVRPEDVVGKTVFDLQDKDIAATLWKKDLEIMETGCAQIIEEPIILDGKKGIMISHKAPMRDSNGRVIGLLGASISIMAQKQKENELALTLKNVLINLPGHIYWKNKNGTILGCNDKQAQYFGFKTEKDLIGKTDYDLYEKSIADKIRVNDLYVMKEGKTEIVEESIDINNQHRVVISNKSPFIDPTTGDIKGVIGVSVDITKQKELEELYRKQTQDLTKALEVKDTFLTNMSHEIRTPLQGIFGLLELLEDEEIWNKTPDSEKRRMFKNVLDSRDRFMNLLSNLLDLSDLRKGRETIQLGYHDMKTLISNTAQEFQNFTESITMDVPANVNTYISCDDWRISQVLHNVIANCIKHGGQDKPIHIALDTLKDKDKKTYLQIAVQDEGVGIPEDQLEEIFDPFTESNRTRRISGGTGIGLALCRDIIAAHRGKIWAENNASGIGSTFFIALPYADHPKKIYSYRLTQRS